ncbi:MAG: 6-phosphogluconolactonase [Tepidisphaeraceae bacterium]
MRSPQIKVQLDPAAVAGEAAERFIALADESIRDSGRFSVALAGGSTPKAMYELLAGEPYRARVDWAKVHVYFGDERTVPPDHAESNYRMAREALLWKVPIPDDNVHRMRGELPDPNEAAKEYGQMLKQTFGDAGGLDLVLLGMGDDGHTASLFPGTVALNETHHRSVANFVPKLNTWRITLSAPFINRARHVLVLVTGHAKASRVAEVIEGAPDPQRLPIQLIRPEQGTMTWLLDAGAAGMTEG